MLLQELREQVVYYGRQMLESGLTMHTGGNLSARDRETGLIAIKPSSKPYDLLKPEDITVIDIEGNVFVNKEKLDEPYVTEKTLGDCDLEFPYQVSGTGYFVMGDKRSNSVDSRNSAIGAVERDDILGKVFLRVWPLPNFGFIT